MISVQEALQLIQNQGVTPSSELRLANESLGYHLAEPVMATFDLPPFNNSAMDGYALCGSGKVFEVVGEVAAGDNESKVLESGQAMRIFTGGKVPQNTTSVVMQEKVSRTDNSISLEDEIPVGKNIRKRGDEIAEGQEVFSIGHLITPASVGMISSLGLDKVKVYKKPQVRIIATGNELIQPGQVRLAGQIYESNTHTLATALIDHGYDEVQGEVVEDQPEAISKSIREALEACDVLLLSGGISVGDYDFVGQALADNGVEEVFYKVFQRPGKPLYFGKKEKKFVFALPGNPASSLTCLYVYGLPLLGRLSGGGGSGLQRVFLPLLHDYEEKNERPAFLKGLFDQQGMNILDGQGSSMIRSMAIGNALVYLQGPKLFKSGDLVECLLI